MMPQCPKCHSNLRTIAEPSLSSSLDDGESQLIHGLHCWACGYFRDIIEPPVRPMPKTQRLQAPKEGAARGGRPKLEPGQSGRYFHPDAQKCRDYILTVFEEIQGYLLQGKMFSSIHRLLPADRPACRKPQSLSRYYRAELARRKAEQTA